MKFVRSQTNKSAVCEVLQINRSTVYYKKKRKPDELEKAVIEIFRKHNSNYGSRRIKVVLNRQGITISKTRICKVLSNNGLEPKYGRRKLTRNIHTNKDERYIAENLTKNLTVTRSNQVAHTDFTEIKCSDGKLFVSGIIDAYDKTVVLKVGTRQTKELVCENLALLKNKPEIFHSDRGPQYTSSMLRDYLNTQNVQRSMSAPYCSCENSQIETFWKTLKTEIGATNHFTKHQASLVLAYYAHYYNNERIHSSIGYITPMEKRTLSF